MVSKIVQCLDDSNWHGELCVVDMILDTDENSAPLCVLLSNRRVGCHITDSNLVKECVFS